MRRYLFLIVVLALSTVLSINAHAGKVTVDPNSPEARAASEPVAAAVDERLAVKVTYEARHAAIKQILDDLSKLTGVTLKAGYNSQDWQVRDRKMNIFAKDLPLSKIMESMARVMKFKWSRSDEAKPPVYRLFMDRRTLLDAEAKQLKAEEIYLAETLKRRGEFVDGILNWKEPANAEEAQKLKEDNPYYYSLYKRGTGKLMQAMFKEVPGLADNFRNMESNRYVSVASLSPDIQGMLLHSMQEMWKLKGLNPRSGNPGNEPFPDYVEQWMGESKLYMYIVPQDVNGQARNMHRYFGGFGMLVHNKRYFLVDHMRDQDNPIEQFSAKETTEALEQDVSLRDVHKKHSAEWERLEIEDREAVDSWRPTEAVVEYSDEPELHKDIKMQLDTKEAAEVKDNKAALVALMEKAVADLSGYGVVGDSFAVIDGSMDITACKGELAEVLDDIAASLHYNWEKHGDVIEFRDRDWFKKRASQIPDEWLDKWKADFKKNGYLTIDTFGQMASLTPEQIGENIRADKLFGKVKELNHFAGLFNGRMVFRLYASLNPTQKKLFLGTPGLEYMALNPEQQQFATKVFRYRDDYDSFSEIKKVWASSAPQIYCSATLTEKDAKKHCDFFVHSADGNELRWWGFILPKYPEEKAEVVDPAKK